MSDQKSNPILDAFFAGLAGIVIKEIPQLAESAVKAILHKHAKTIAEAAVPITEEVVAKLCPAGYIRDPQTGECVKDPG
jgi:hypothetical protein